MGLLDSILAQGQSGGGIFGGLYPSSLQPDQQQMDYDAMGNPIPKYLSADSPFPALPAQAAAVPQMAAQAPVAGGFGPWGAGSFMPQQQPIAPAPQPPVQPPTDVSSINRGPDRTIDIGGYQMPQFGRRLSPIPLQFPRARNPRSILLSSKIHLPQRSRHFSARKILALGTGSQLALAASELAARVAVCSVRLRAALTASRRVRVAIRARLHNRTSRLSTTLSCQCWGRRRPCWRS